MLEQLFGSKTRVNVLRLFMVKPDSPLYVREITRAVRSQINAVRRELENLEDIGLIKETAIQPIASVEEDPSASKRKYFILCQDNLLYPELRSLLLKSQLLQKRKFADEIVSLGNVDYVSLLGIFVEDGEAPTDLILVTRVPHRRIEQLIRRYERSLGHAIRYSLFSPSEFRERRNVMDKFLYGLFERPMMVMHNSIMNTGGTIVT